MKKKSLRFLVCLAMMAFIVSCHKTDIPDCVQFIKYEYYDAIGDVRTIDEFTYSNGLLDNVYPFDGTRFKMEYDSRRKLSGAKGYDGSTILYDISFKYTNGRISEETWIDPGTGDLSDHVLLTYNSKGQLSRNQSLVYDFYVDYVYYANGGLRSWKLVEAGAPLILAEYTYKDNYKNPFAMIKGTAHAFWYANSGFGIGSGERWYSSEKVSYYNADGVPETYYEQDPAKTIWTGLKGYAPKQADYFDALTGGKIQNIFDYQDCNKPGKPLTTITNHSSRNRKPGMAPRPFGHVNMKKLPVKISPSKTW